MYSIALRLTGSESAAEDVVHDVFMRLQRDQAIGHIEDLTRWLCGAAAKRSLMHLRGTRRKREVSVDAYVYLGTPVNGRSIEAIALERGIARLPPKLRVVFLLHHVSGFSHAEIAGQLGISPAASGKRLSRAVDRLRHHLGGPR